MTDLEDVYQRRFPEAAHRQKEQIWPPIVRVLERYVDRSAPVLDIGCDRGYLVRNVRADERWATDVRDVSAHLPDDVRFVHADGLKLADVLPHAYFGGIFMSNYLEHLPSSDAVIEQLRVVRRLLRPDGRVVILQPNIRLVGGAYWDFIDHKVPLTERSLVEAGEVAGLSPIHVITHFLPYTTKGTLPAHPLLVRAYLRLPIVWRLLARQSLYVAGPSRAS
jgi:SAM-dependent methyltransferase